MADYKPSFDMDSAQNSYNVDLGELFNHQDLNEEWVEHRLEETSNSNSVKNNTVKSSNTIGTGTAGSFDFDVATTKIEYQDRKRTPMFMRAVNAQHNNQEDSRARSEMNSLVNLFEPPVNSESFHTTNQNGASNTQDQISQVYSTADGYTTNLDLPETSEFSPHKQSSISFSPVPLLPHENQLFKPPSPIVPRHWSPQYPSSSSSSPAPLLSTAVTGSSKSQKFEFEVAKIKDASVNASQTSLLSEPEPDSSKLEKFGSSKTASVRFGENSYSGRTNVANQVASSATISSRSKPSSLKSSPKNRQRQNEQISGLDELSGTLQSLNISSPQRSSKPTSPTNPQKRSVDPSESHKSSPMKLFGNHDTYTNGRLNDILGDNFNSIGSNASLASRSLRISNSDDDSKGQEAEIANRKSPKSLRKIQGLSSIYETSVVGDISEISERLRDLSISEKPNKKESTTNNKTTTASSSGIQTVSSEVKKITHQDYKKEASAVFLNLLKNKPKHVLPEREQESSQSVDDTSESSRPSGEDDPLPVNTTNLSSDYASSDDSFKQIRRHKSFYEEDSNGSNASSFNSKTNDSTEGYLRPTLDPSLRYDVSSQPYSHAHLPSSPAQVSSRQRYPHLNQITPQEYAQNPELFNRHSGSNNMLLDPITGKWRPAPGFGSGSTLLDEGVIELKGPEKVPNVPAAQEAADDDVFDGIEDLQDSPVPNKEAISRQEFSSPPDSPVVETSGNSLVVSNNSRRASPAMDQPVSKNSSRTIQYDHSVQGQSTINASTVGGVYGQLSRLASDSSGASGEYHRVVLEESYEASSLSSGSVIVTNRARRVSQYGVHHRGTPVAHMSASQVSSPESPSPSITNISIVQASFSQALGDTIRIVPFDSDGNERQSKVLNIPPNDELSTTTWIGKLHPNLEILKAPSGNIRYLHGLPNTLRELYLADNHVEEYGTSFSGLANLEVVDLKGNGISDGGFLGPLQHLTVLNLSNNKLNSLNGLPVLRSLRQFTLDGNNLTGILDLQEWTNLTVLSLKGNKRLTGVSGINEESKLRELYLDDCDDLELISGNTKNLLKLTINNCSKITQLDLRHFPKLQILKADGVPELTEFKNGYVPNSLRTVSLCSQTKTLCNGSGSMFTSLCEVQRLRISHTPILNLNFGQEFFLNLHLLDLSGCGLKELPENFDERCCNLRVLDLSDNEITDTQCLMAIPKLVSLNLRGNQIDRKWFRVLISTIRNLQHLTELDTRDNPVTRRIYSKGSDEDERLMVSRMKYRNVIAENSYGLNILDGSEPPAGSRFKEADMMTLTSP